MSLILSVVLLLIILITILLLALIGFLVGVTIAEPIISILITFTIAVVTASPTEIIETLVATAGCLPLVAFALVAEHLIRLVYLLELLGGLTPSFIRVILLGHFIVRHLDLPFI